MRDVWLRIVLTAWLLVALSGTGGVADDLGSARGFLKQNCYDCHEGPLAEGGLDLTQLDNRLEDPATFARWVRIHDRVRSGEMPPPDYAKLQPAEVRDFVTPVAGELFAQERRTWDEQGRVRGRRLTNLQVERSLHDLLGIDIPLANSLPDETRVGGFTTVADGQSMSYFQLERHLAVVDQALEEAHRRAVTGSDEFVRELNVKQIARQDPKRRNREPEIINDLAVIWASRLIFYGRLPSTTARDDGWYRFTIRASALKSPPEHGVWCTVRSGPCVSSAPLLNWLGAFEATDEAQEWTFEGWLPKGHMLEVRPGDLTLKMARFAGGQVGVGEGGPQNVPGVAFHSIVVERFHRGPDDQGLRELLFDDLKVEPATRRQPGRLISDQPRVDAERLIQRFAQRAFRRPIQPAEVAQYVSLVHEALDRDEPLLESLLGGYRAILCSPRFLYLHEEPGRLDAYAVATRLSYFLWSAPPDETLLNLAAEGRLLEPATLRAQVQRMLDDPRGEGFIPDLAAEWLDLCEIEATEPDAKLYPGFDVIIQNSMLQETHAFLQTLLTDDLGVGHLIDSDFTYLNSRLARHYGIDGVEGDELRRFALRPQHRRGGVLTQGAILKVTANGSTTSPVIRGVWVNERLLGTHIPPPPENVPAIEPDIRGATSIREELAKHREVESCASCHVKIDPPGFALENFDPAGRWREHYPRLQGGRRVKGAEVDPSYELPDGTRFDDLAGFRQLVLAQPRALAKNVAEKFITYGTGAPVGFADRQVLDDVVDGCADSNYGFRSLLMAVVTSPVFLEK